MEDYMSLNEMFGIAEPEVKAETEPQKKSKTKAKDKAEKTKKPDNYKCPFTLNMGGKEEEVTSKECGEESITLKGIKDFVERKYAQYPSDIINVAEEGNIFFVTYKETGIPKGDIRLNENTKFMFHSFEIALPTDSQETVTVQKLQECFKKEYGEYFPQSDPLWKQIKILQSTKRDIIVPVLPFVEVNSVPITDTLTFILPNREVVSLERPEQEALHSKQDTHISSMKDLNGEEEREDNADEAQANDETEPSQNELSLEEIASSVEKKGFNFRNRLLVSKAGTENSYSLWMKNGPATAAAAVALVLYPVDGVTLSILFAKYLLSTEDFGGKKNVTEEELLNFLKNKHPEFGIAKNIQIMCDKEKKMIVIVAAGNRKGVDTPMFSYSKENGFLWKLNMIPYGIYKQGEAICDYVTRRYRTEVCLNLYYSTKTGIFFWYMPAQRVDGASVELCNNVFLDTTEFSGLVRIGQFHSHGVFPAFFSGIDDADELFPGIYGVWGNRQRGESFLMRAVIEPYRYHALTVEDIFKDWEDSFDGSWLYADEIISNELFFDCSPKEQLFNVYNLNDKTVLFLEGFCPVYLSFIYSQCDNLYVYNYHSAGQGFMSEYKLEEVSKASGIIISLYDFGSINVTLTEDNFKSLNERQTVFSHYFLCS